MHTGAIPPIAVISYRALSLMLVIMSSVVIVGWYIKSSTLVQIHHTFVPMQFNTALCFALSGLALFCTNAKKSTLTTTASTLAALTSGLTLIEYVSGLDLKIDTLFIDPFTTVRSPNPGRMGANTAFSFFLANLAIIALIRFPSIKTFRLFGPAVTGLGLIAGFGYIIDVDTAYGWGNFSGMAVHTSIGFITLGVAISVWGVIQVNRNNIKDKLWQIRLISTTAIVFVIALWQALSSWQNNNIRNYFNDQLATISTSIEVYIHSMTISSAQLVPFLERNGGIDFLSSERWNTDITAFIENSLEIESVAIFDKNMSILDFVSEDATPDTSIILNKLDLNSLNNLYSDPSSEVFIGKKSSLQFSSDSSKIFIATPFFKESSFNGILVSTVSSSVLLTLFPPNTKESERYSIILSRNNLHVTVINTNKETNKNFTSNYEINIAGDIWAVSLTPSKETVKNLSSILPEFSLFGGLVLTIILIMLYLSRLREQEKSDVLLAEITQHNETRQLLLYKESRLRITLEAMADAVVLFNEHEEIQNFNQAAENIFGYKKSDLKNSKIQTLLPNSELSTFQEYTILLEKPEDNRDSTFTREILAKRKNGEIFPINLSISVIKIENEYLFSVIIRDITDQKRSQAALNKYMKELERSNKELNDFAYIASHDLKAPLRGIMQIAIWISEDLQGQLTEQMSEYLDLMKSRVWRLEKLLNDLLSYSRAGRNHGDFHNVNIEDMAKEVFNMLSPPKEFKLEFGRNISEFTTLSVPFELILRNLINNAIKHHDKSTGTIKVESRQQGEIFEFIVTDDGPGIEPKYHQQVFQLFQTLRPRDEVEGSGMGLTVIKKLLDTYQGDIHVESDGKRGTRMIFTWPTEMNLREQIND